MPQYKNLPDNYALFKRPFIKSLPVFILIFMACVVSSYYSGTTRGNFFNKDTIFMMVMFVVVFSISYYLAQKRQKQVFFSYLLTIDDEKIIRYQSNLPVMMIPFHEITKVEEAKKNMLVVRGMQKEAAIAVWPYIENYDEVRTLLQSHYTITPIVYKNIFHKYPRLLGMLMLAGMLGVIASNNKIILIISGLLFFSTIGWSFYKVRTAKQVDKQTKAMAWFMIPLFFIFLMVIIKKLTV